MLEVVFLFGYFLTFYLMPFCQIFSKIPYEKSVVSDIKKSF